MSLIEVPEQPMRDVYRVVSDNTGAVIVDECESMRDAATEAKRLNDEARRDRIIHLGAPQSYRAIGPCRVIDGVAHYTNVRDELAAKRRKAKASERDAIEAQYLEVVAALDAFKLKEEGE